MRGDFLAWAVAGAIALAGCGGRSVRAPVEEAGPPDGRAGDADVAAEAGPDALDGGGRDGEADADVPGWDEGAAQDTWVLVRRAAEAGRSLASALVTLDDDVVVVGLMAGRLWAARLDGRGAVVWQTWLEPGEGGAWLSVPRASPTVGGDVAVAAAVMPEEGEWGRPWLGRIDGATGALAWQIVPEGTTSEDAVQVLGASDGTTLLAWAGEREEIMDIPSWVAAWTASGRLAWGLDEVSGPSLGLLEIAPGRTLDMAMPLMSVVEPDRLLRWAAPFRDGGSPLAGVARVDGGVVAAGAYPFDMQDDLWVGAADEHGEQIWSVRLPARLHGPRADCFPDCDDDRAEAIVRTSRDELVACGTVAGAFETGTRGFMLWLDENGAVLSQRWLGLDGGRVALHAVAERAGRLVVAGEWDGDALVASLDLYGEVEGSCSPLGDGDLEVLEPRLAPFPTESALPRVLFEPGAEEGTLRSARVEHEADFVCPE